MMHRAPNSASIDIANTEASSWALLLQEWGPVILLALVPALPLLLGGGLLNTRAGGDSPFLLIRVQQLVLNLRSGVFPVRWMPQAAYGLGYPFFNFYASLPYYLAAVCKLLGLGYVTSIQLTQLLAFVFAGMSIYGLAREMGYPRSANLLVVLAYSCAPFHMVNVYVRGDSLSEFYAFVFFPLILWSFLRLQKEPTPSNAMWAGLAYAGLILSHNISAMIFSPAVVLWALWLLVHASARKSFVWYCVLSLATGALLSAWFVIPALAERADVYLKDMTTGYFHYAQHFRSTNLVQHSLAFDWAITEDKQPFAMGLVQAVMAAVGLLAMLMGWIRRRHIEGHDMFIVVLLAASTWMITPWSAPIWSRLPLLQMAQFPWRFLSIQALPTSLLAAYLIPKKPWQTIVTWALALVVACSMLIGLRPERLYIEENDITAQRLMQYEYFTANVGTTIRTDYLPRDVDPRPYTSQALLDGDDTKPAPLVLAGQFASCNLISLQSTAEEWVIDVTSPGTRLGFHTYYYPGWEARVDGQRTSVEPLPGLGYIGLRLDPGKHTVKLYLGRTRTQALGEVLSILTLVMVVVLIMRSTHPHWPAVILATAALAMLTVMTIAIGAPYLAQPAAPLQDLTMDFDRLPYLHHNPGGLRFGDAVRLLSYQLSSEEIQAGNTLAVSTHWGAAQRNDLRVQIALASPAQHLFAVPVVVSADEKALETESLFQALTVPGDTPAGVYLLRLQVSSPEGNVSPLSLQGETLGTTYLLPIHVSSELRATPNTPSIQHYGDSIALTLVDTRQLAPGMLGITLTWNVLATPPQNYKIALRLHDPTGWEVARLDTQPGYGFYPTSLWHPGQLINDSYALVLDDGTSPGTDYSLDVTLYESASLKPIGSVQIAQVAITQPTQRSDYSVLHAFGTGLALCEVQWSKAEVQQGEKLTGVLKWAATAQVSHNYQCRLRLQNEGGDIVSQQILPLTDTYPSSQWPQDALLAVHCSLPVAVDLPPGLYQVLVDVNGLESANDWETFPLSTSIRVSEAPRNFAVPTMQNTVGTDFGGQVRLLGFDLERSSRELILTLHWQALTTPAQDLKVFTHLFDPQTERIAAQQDILLGGESHPTTRWVAQEIVSSRIVLPLSAIPTGVYHLGIGLYQPEGRLSVAAPQGWTVSADRLLLRDSIPVP